MQALIKVIFALALIFSVLFAIVVLLILVGAASWLWAQVS